MTDEQPHEAHSSRPLLRVVSGEPDDTELAVVVAVLSARSGAAAAPPVHWSLWSRKSRQTRASLRPGFGAWRGSMMPR